MEVNCCWGSVLLKLHTMMHHPQLNVAIADSSSVVELRSGEEHTPLVNFVLGGVEQPSGGAAGPERFPVRQRWDPTNVQRLHSGEATETSLETMSFRVAMKRLMDATDERSDFAATSSFSHLIPPIIFSVISVQSCRAEGVGGAKLKQ